MKTKDFIEKVKTAGFNVNVRCEDIQVHHHRYGLIATVQINKRYVFDIRQHFDLTSLKEQEKLFSCIVEYARTPLEERAEEKKYYVKLNIPILNELADDGSHFLNQGLITKHFLADKDQENGYQTQFTNKEINEFPREVKALLPLCEKIEVTP